MHEAVIVSARSPIGTAFKGSLVDVDAFHLGTRVIAESVRRAVLRTSVMQKPISREWN
jgi:hypothetical protein